MFTAERMNQKTVFSGTGAQIAAIGTTYAGMLAFCTSTGSGFTAGVMYQRIEDNSAWKVVNIPTLKVVIPAAAASDYASPVSPVTSSNSSNIQNASYNTYYKLDSLDYTRVAQKITLAMYVTQVRFDLYKSGSPTGTAYVRIRKVSDDSIIATSSTTLDVSTLTGSPAWSAFAFSSVEVNEAVYVSIEYSGGDASNFVAVEALSSSAIDGNIALYSGVWSENALRDFTIEINGENQKGGTVDDNISTYWKSVNEVTPWVYVDCGALKLLSGCRIYWNTNGRPTGFDIDVSEDASSWTEVYSTASQPSTGWQEYSWNTRYARYIRFQGDGTLRMEVAEVDYYLKASDRVIAEHGHGDV